jgi:photosystem II stability/assembly factor-like uncharacterized protein
MKAILILLSYYLLLSCTSVKNHVQSNKVLTVEVINKDTKNSFRGLSVVTDNIVWVSGNNGTVGRSTDGGRTWKWIVVPGFEKNDFRDIEAFDSSTAIIMAVAEPAYILKTTNGGVSWSVVYQNNTKGMFLDAMDFTDNQNGIVIGDPIDSKFFIAKTSDGGNTWQDLPDILRPQADTGEALFAASGTNIKILNKDKFVFVTGGLSSRFFKSGRVERLPLLQGKETTGANSIATFNRRKYIITGGDFNAPNSDTANAVLSTNAGKSWTLPQQAPNGYRSCVEYLSKNHLISCGISGVDYSTDGGLSWKMISKEGFHVVQKAKSGTAIFLAGGGGKIGRVISTKTNIQLYLIYPHGGKLTFNSDAGNQPILIYLHPAPAL